MKQLPDLFLKMFIMLVVIACAFAIYEFSTGNLGHDVSKFLEALHVTMS